jgi:transcriptional regulator with XRE-family HTH domain
VASRRALNDLKHDVLASMSAADRATYDATANATRLALDVGEKVRDAREAARLSQRELASRMGTSQAAVARLEAGGVGATLTTLQRVSDALKLTIDVELRPQARPPSRSTEWRRRTMFEQLGVGYELWDLARPKQAVHDRLADRLAKLGRTYADNDLAYMLVEHSLLEVVNAAEGAERSLAAMRRNAMAAQISSDRLRSSQGTGVPRADREYWTDPEVVDVWYEFLNMLTWVRSLEDRIDRKDLTGKRRLGLLPSLATAQLKQRVGKAYRRFEQGPAAEARRLTNYGIHAGLLPSPGTPSARVKADGVLSFVMPDPVRSAIDNWQEFTFRGERDALAFAGELFEAVAEFIDLVLDAFRDAVPERFRRDALSAPPG